MSINELTKKLKELKELKAMAQELAAEINTIEDVIKAHMGEREELRVAGYKVTYKKVKSSRLDGKSLKMELPEVAARYTVATEYRRFSIA